MDEAQINKLGDKMKSVYDDVQAHAEGTADQVSGQAQNAYGSARRAAKKAAGSAASEMDSLMTQQPFAALLAAVGVGYVLAYLIHRR